MTGVITTPNGMVHLKKSTVRALSGTDGKPSDNNKFVTDSDNRLSDDRVAKGIRTATTEVSINTAAAPLINQALIAVDGTSATWQDVTSDTVPLDITKSTALSGVSPKAARVDHKHSIATDNVISVGPVAAEGISTSLARADHVHPGLTRNPNDFSLFSNKQFTADNDSILIEDSADSGSKKHVKLSDLMHFEHSRYDTQVNAGTSYTTYHSFTTKSVGPGTYRFAWYYEYCGGAGWGASSNTTAQGQIYIDNVLRSQMLHIPRSTDDRFLASGFYYETFTSTGTHVIRLDISRSGSQTTRFYLASFEFWRVL